MSNKFISKTLAIFSFTFLFLAALPQQKAHAIDLQPCWVLDDSGVKIYNPDVGVDDICFSDKGKPQMLKSANCAEDRAEDGVFGRIKHLFTGSCFKSAKKEFKQRYGTQRVAVRAAVACNTCQLQEIAVDDEGAGDGAGDVVVRRGGSGRRAIDDDGVVVARRGGGSLRNRGLDVVTRARQDANDLDRLCGDSGQLLDQVDVLTAKLKTADDDRKKYPQEGCTGDSCYDNYKDIAKDMKDALQNCHKGCVAMAITDKKSACYWDNLKKGRVKTFDGADAFCGTFTKNEQGRAVAAFFNEQDQISGQNHCSNLALDSNKENDRALCDMLENSPTCAQEMRAEDTSFNCPAYQDLADKYRKAKANYDTAMALYNQLKGDSDPKTCRVTSAKDANDAWANKDKVSGACMTDIAASCQLEPSGPLIVARKNYETVATNYRRACATCNLPGDDGNGGISMNAGGGCNGGCNRVSTAAQILGALNGPIAAGFGYLGTLSNNHACMAQFRETNTTMNAIGIPLQTYPCPNGFNSGSYFTNPYAYQNSYMSQFQNPYGFMNTGFSQYPGGYNGFNGGVNLGFNNGFPGGFNNGFPGGFNGGFNGGGAPGYALNNGYNTGYNGGYNNGQAGYALNNLAYTNGAQNIANVAAYPQLINSLQYQNNYTQNYQSPYGYMNYQPSYYQQQPGLSFNAGFNYNSGYNNNYLYNQGGAYNQYPYLTQQAGGCGTYGSYVPCY